MGVSFRETLTITKKSWIDWQTHLQQKQRPHWIWALWSWAVREKQDEETRNPEALQATRQWHYHPWELLGTSYGISRQVKLCIGGRGRHEVLYADLDTEYKAESLGLRYSTLSWTMVLWISSRFIYILAWWGSRPHLWHEISSMSPKRRGYTHKGEFTCQQSLHCRALHLLGQFWDNGKTYQFVSVALLFEREPTKLH